MAAYKKKTFAYKKYLAVTIWPLNGIHQAYESEDSQDENDVQDLATCVTSSCKQKNWSFNCKDKDSKIS